MKVFKPRLNGSEFEICRLAHELRLRAHIRQRSEIPNMASSVDQVFRVLIAPITLGCEIRVIAQIFPWISAPVNKQQSVSGEVEVSIDIPSFKLGCRGYGIIFAC
jgi:hypothetical protein